MKNNRNGFTLIELLAVIVILAILVMIAIPATTKYLQTARQGAFADNAQIAIEEVRTDVASKGFGQGANSHCSGTTCTYNQNDINELLSKKLTNSPFGGTYSCAIVTVTQTGDSSNPVYTYSMKMIDSNGNGFDTLTEKEISADKVVVDGSLSCS